MMPIKLSEDDREDVADGAGGEQREDADRRRNDTDDQLKSKGPFRTEDKAEHIKASVKNEGSTDQIAQDIHTGVRPND